MKKGMKVLGLCLFVVGVLLLGETVLVFAQKPAIGWGVYKRAIIEADGIKTYEVLEGTEASLSTDSHTGKYSGYVKTTSSQKGQKGYTQGWVYSITSLLKPNSEYMLAGWVKTDLKKGADVEFSCHLYDKKPYTSDSIHGFATSNMKGANNWTHKKIMIKTPGTIATATILFIVHKKGEAWVDDVSLIDVSTGKNLLENPGFEIIEEGSIKEEPMV